MHENIYFNRYVCVLACKQYFKDFINNKGNVTLDKIHILQTIHIRNILIGYYISTPTICNWNVSKLYNKEDGVKKKKNDYAVIRLLSQINKHLCPT